jgi:hypothetical protein
MKVFLLWHSYESDHNDCDHEFLLGVYSTREKAEARQSDAVHDRDFAVIPTASSQRNMKST